MASILLHNGSVLVHGQNDHITVWTNTDVLIVGNKISKIAKNIKPHGDAAVIDCIGKIVCPGFIDTHHHVWQTQLRGRHANELILDYLATGNLTSSLFSAEDIFWGQLGGCLEMLDVGTTTVVDHAHFNYSPAHNHSALSATISSGLRSVFCYCPTPRVDSWSPFQLNQNLLEDWVVETFEEIATAGPYGDGRVTIGFAFDGWFLPREHILPLFEKVKQHGVRTVTTHIGNGAILGFDSVPGLIESLGLLDERMILSHSMNPTSKEVALYKEKNIKISSTPHTESQMGMGPSVCFQDELGLQNQCSLGVDCHTNNTASMVSQMRLALQAARARADEKLIDQAKSPRVIYKTVEEALNLATIQGARATGMEDKIGSIAEGKLADLVIFDGTSPSMVCAAEHDPVAAIVLHSSPADVDTVIVNGDIRKRGGCLEPVKLDARGQGVTGQETIRWKDVAKELIKGRAALQKRVEPLDMAAARKGIIQAYHIDETNLVDRS